MKETTTRTHNSATINDVIQQAIKPARNYQQKQKNGYFRPKYARFKCKMYWKDGNSSVHYSYDFFHRYVDGVKERIADEQGGFSKLLRMIDKRQGNYISGMIWMCFSQDKATENSVYNYTICKFVGGRATYMNNLLNFNKNQVLIRPLLEDATRKNQVT